MIDDLVIHLFDVDYALRTLFLALDLRVNR